MSNQLTDQTVVASGEKRTRRTRTKKAVRRVAKKVHQKRTVKPQMWSLINPRGLRVFLSETSVRKLLN